MIPLVIAAILLAGEPVAFDANARPAFSERHLRAASRVTREGLVRWSATESGRRLIRRFAAADYEVHVIEDAFEPGAGRAPQPGIETMMFHADPGRTKRYQVILNPEIALRYDARRTIDLGEVATPVDVMAAAWAGEMLHVAFYADGIQLPHHHRPDFQQRWQTVANELGLPRVAHEDAQ